MSETGTTSEVQRPGRPRHLRTQRQLHDSSRHAVLYREQGRVRRGVREANVGGGVQNVAQAKGLTRLHNLFLRACLGASRLSWT